MPHQHTRTYGILFEGDFLADINEDNPLGMKGEIARQYAKLVSEVCRVGDDNLGDAVTPKSFKSALAKFAPQFRGVRQHDSQELVAFLLDGLNEDLNKVKDKPYIQLDEKDGQDEREFADLSWNAHLQRNKSIIQKLFHGQFKSVVTCPSRTCQHSSRKFDPLMYVSLSLKSLAGHAETTNGKLKLTDMLQHFVAEEELKKGDEWTCPKCSASQQAFKKIEIWRLPQILVLHLKRFSQGKYRRSKADTEVVYPLLGLDMAPYISGSSPDRTGASTLYDCYAVSHHSGGLGFGHYTATVRNGSSSEWTRFNDARVGPADMPASEQASATAYLLFYRRREMKRSAM